MKKIKLTQGKYALVDNKDFERLNKFKWHFKSKKNKFHGTGYAYKWGANNKRMFMHHMVLKRKNGKFNDHINGNGLDNRRKNLRYCSAAQNMWNRGKYLKNNSKYKGAHWHTTNKTWVANISVNGKQFHLGTFESEICAAKAYNVAAKKHHGEFACLNRV